jgi:membrane fusion protein, multidrug efflux system
MKKIILALLTAGVLGGGYYWYAYSSPSEPGMADNQSSGSPGGERATPVIVREARVNTLGDSIEALGTTLAYESVTLTAKITESVSAVNFEDGDFVRRGDILLELLKTEEQAALREAVAQRDEAAKQLERAERLVAQDSLAQTTLDQRRAEMEATLARVSAIEARLADRIILAPFDGRLGLRRVSVGTLVRPGDEITTLDDISRIKLDFTVPEVYLSALEPGQKVSARAAAFPGEVFTGEIRSLDSRVNPSTRALTVRAVFPNPQARLLPGMLMTVSIEANRREALVIPEEALIPVGDRQFVFTVNSENRAERVEVHIGARRPGQVEILGGLDAGSQVITEGGIRLAPGGLVNVLSKRES